MVAVNVLLQSSTDTPKVGEQYCLMLFQWEKTCYVQKVFTPLQCLKKCFADFWNTFMGNILGGYCWVTWTLDQHLLICFPSQGREIQNICLFLVEVMDKHNFIIPFLKGSTEKINILKIPSFWFFFPFCKNIRKSIALNNLPTLL